MTSERKSLADHKPADHKIKRVSKVLLEEARWNKVEVGVEVREYS